MRKILAIATLTAMTAFTAMPANAQFAKAEDAIKYRESAMALLGFHFGAMGPVAKKEVPFDAERIQANMEVVQTLAALPWPAFEDEAYEGGNEMPELWLDPDGFQEKREAFEQNLEKLVKATDAGDFDAFRVAYGNTGQSCKSCHDSYRQSK